MESADFQVLTKCNTCRHKHLCKYAIEFQLLARNMRAQWTDAVCAVKPVAELRCIYFVKEPDVQRSI